MDKYPIVLRRRLPDEREATLLIDKIPTLEALLEESNIADIGSIADFGAESRRRERLAWRVMLRDFLEREVEIEYLPSGKPLLHDKEYSHISVSHCKDLVAVALSHRECGVDIERLDRRFESVAERYMTPREIALSSEPLLRAIVWSAKEVLYKMAGREALDLREDIHIEAINSTQREVVGYVTSEGRELLRCRMSYYLPDEEHILLYYL